MSIVRVYGRRRLRQPDVKIRKGRHCNFICALSLLLSAIYSLVPKTVVPLKEITLRKQEIAFPSDSFQEGFPRNPIYRKLDCRLEYTTHIRFCVLQNEAFHALYAHLVKRLLEYHFQCQSNDLEVVIIDADNNDDCFVIGNNQTSIQSTYPSSSLLLTLLPQLLQDYYWKPTKVNARKLICRFRGVVTTSAMTFDSSRTILLSLKLPWQDFLKQFCLCDAIVSEGIAEIHQMALAFGIPVISENNVIYEQTVWGGTYSIGADRTSHSVDVSLASTFPYHLVRDTQPVPIGATLNTPRVLVILIGNLRGGERTWETLYRNVLDPNNADLALCIGARNDTNKRSSLYNRAKYLWEYPEFDDWADAIDLIQDSTWRAMILGSYHNDRGGFGGVKGHIGSGAVIFMSRWFAAHHIQQLNLTTTYDRFIVTRSDHYYACLHDLRELDNRYMWVPKGEDYENGITDRHLICNSGQILPALDIYPPIVQHPDKYVDYQFSSSTPEQMLRHRWEEENLWKWVKRFDRQMFTCAVMGDTTRWRVPGKGNVSEGVYLKYPSEYFAAKCNCNGDIYKYPPNGTCMKKI